MNPLEQPSPGCLSADRERVSGSQSRERGGVLDSVPGAWKGSAIAGGEWGVRGARPPTTGSSCLSRRRGDGLN